MRSGTLWVRFQYARGTLHTRFVPTWHSRRASNLVHVLYVLFASRNRGLAGFGSAGSDRDNYYRYPDTLLSVEMVGRQGGATDHAGLHDHTRTWDASGAVKVRSWCGRGTLTVWSRYSCGAVEVRSWCGRSTLVVRSRYARVRFQFSAVPVQCGSLTFQRVILYLVA